jgi:protoheme IX farnesyltransferase
MMEKTQNTLTQTAVFNPSAVFSFFQLMKPRVMSLVIFTGFVGMYLAPDDLHPVLAFISLIAIAAGAGASAAINQWYDRDIDAVMQRTRTRPIPSGEVEPSEALSFGVIISVISVLILSLSANFLAGGLLAFTIIFYGLVYTVWLKRSTAQNIVIGGAAGALPPIIGWSAATESMSIEPIILFSLIFFWTPPHFWALALVKSQDYKKAKIPMLPVVAGGNEARKQIFIYSIIMVGISLLPNFIGMAKMLYGSVAGISGFIFLVLAFQLFRQPDDNRAMRLFKYSIAYLFILFSALICDEIILG